MKTLQNQIALKAIGPRVPPPQVASAIATVTAGRDPGPRTLQSLPQGHPAHPRRDAAGRHSGVLRMLSRTTAGWAPRAILRCTSIHT